MSRLSVCGCAESLSTAEGTCVMSTAVLVSAKHTSARPVARKVDHSDPHHGLPKKVMKLSTFALASAVVHSNAATMYAKSFATKVHVVHAEKPYLKRLLATASELSCNLHFLAAHSHLHVVTHANGRRLADILKLLTTAIKTMTLVPSAHF